MYFHMHISQFMNSRIFRYGLHRFITTAPFESPTKPVDRMKNTHTPPPPHEKRKKKQIQI